MNAIDALLSPRSVAVIGATDRHQYGGRVVDCLQRGGFRGSIYPVNPNHPVIRGLQAYPSVTEIPYPVDLAVIAVPRTAVIEAMDECGRKGVKAASVITAGFAEAGQDGAELQQRLIGVARTHGIRFTGPNSLGLANFHEKTFCSASVWLDSTYPEPGALSIVSQSGGMAFMSLLTRAAQAGVGVSKLITVGNQADLSIGELTNYLIERDETTRVVAIYVEGLPPGGGRELMEAGFRARELHKSILVLKVGRSSVGARAASAHTAAAVGDDAVFDAAMRQAGIVRVEDLDDLWQVGHLLACNEGRRLRGGIAFLANSGGLTTHFTDQLGLRGVPLAPISAKTASRLEAHMGQRGSAGNPADISGQIAETGKDGTLQANPAIVDLMSIVAEDRAVDLVVVGTTAPATGEAASGIADNIIAASKRVGKPIVILWTSVVAPAAAIDKSTPIRRLRDHGIPVFEGPASCAHGLAALRDAAPIVMAKTSARRRSYTGARSAAVDQTIGAELSLVEALGIPTARTQVADSGAAARRAAAAIGFPIVLKILSPELIHKSDQNAVWIGLGDKSALSRALNQAIALGRRMTNWRIAVQEFVKPGVELLLSTTRDPTFGPVVVVGAGGIWVESMRDLSIRVAPVDRAIARAMVLSLRLAPIIRGERGQSGVDVDAIVDAIVAMSRALFASGRDGIETIEVNPLIAQATGVRAVDARLVHRSAEVLLRIDCSGSIE